MQLYSHLDVFLSCNVNFKKGHSSGRDGVVSNGRVFSLMRSVVFQRFENIIVFIWMETLFCVLIVIFLQTKRLNETRYNYFKIKLKWFLQIVRQIALTMFSQKKKKKCDNWSVLFFLAEIFCTICSQHKPTWRQINHTFQYVRKTFFVYNFHA